MRKSISAFLIIITFSLSIIFGYSTASLSSAESKSGQQITPQSTPAATQQNLLIIQLDEIKAPQPVLHAVWIAAYFKSANQTVVTITQLFPINQATKLSNQNLNTAFSISADGAPSTKFLKLISSADIKWNGYLMIDDAGALLVEEWLKNQGGLVFNQEDLTPPFLIRSSCDYLNNKVEFSGSIVLKFDWNQFDPHFNTDLALDTLLAGWNGLFDDTRPIRCEVVKE
jgi:hypothetical protein